jgi:hypothetical protein
MIIQRIIERRQRANEEIAADAEWQQRKALTGEAWASAYAAGMERYNRNEAILLCENDAELQGWLRAQELDRQEFARGLNAYLDEMTGHDLDYLETVDEIVDQQYRRWGF